MEDKIVGPLTLIQFLYVLGGGLLIYALMQTLAPRSFALFLILASPIGLVALALAFLKIQEQPLSHFIVAGIKYLTQPKLRFWKRQPSYPKVLTEPPKIRQTIASPAPKYVDKTSLENLAYTLDTGVGHHQKVGQVTKVYEKMLKENKT
jgi:hypothetical protein